MYLGLLFCFNEGITGEGILAAYGNLFSNVNLILLLFMALSEGLDI